MNNLKKILLNKLPEFKDYTLNFLNGNISKTQYKTFSKGYGVYVQKNQNLFMINLRTSCGTITKCQLHTIYQFAHNYGLDYIYISTRQCIQLHNLDIDALINIMEKGIHKNIFTISHRGYFPRNIGPSPLSRVDTEEIFDVTPYALATDKYSKEEIEIHSNNPRLIKQKQVGLYTIRIQPLDGIYKLKDLKSLLSTLDKIKNPIIRIGMMQEIYILNLDGNEAKKVLEITENISKYSSL